VIDQWSPKNNYKKWILLIHQRLLYFKILNKNEEYSFGNYWKNKKGFWKDVILEIKLHNSLFYLLVCSVWSIVAMLYHEEVGEIWKLIKMSVVVKCAKIHCKLI
jgi:hypothetical protein